MSTPLVSASEMAALGELAGMGMQAPVAIWARTTEQTENGQRDTWTYARTVDGWINSTPTPVITLVSGEMATVNTYRLFLPLGTAILPGDHAIIGGQTFIVSDTTVESTWQAMLRVSLRFAE